MTKKNVEELFASINQSIEKLGRQAHAGFAMVIAAALDRLLEHALEEKMVDLNRDMRDKLFGEFGTLRDFGAKINVAFAIGIVDSDTYKRLTTLRKIRNLLAHANEHLDFDSIAVQKLMMLTPGFVATAKSSEAFVALAEAIEVSVTGRAGIAYAATIQALNADW